jgi:hypothetical protein
MRFGILPRISRRTIPGKGRRIRTLGLALADVNERMSALEGARCWNVSAGGSAGSHFLLDLGRMRRLPRQTSFGPHTDYVQIHEGEFIIFVLCSWRLDGPSFPLSSSEVPAESIGKDLSMLTGKTIFRIEATSPAWDLRVTFSDDLSLTVFCDQVTGSEYDYNWEVVLSEESLSAGPGYKITTEARS